MVLKVSVSPDLVHGDADDGYGKVADAFRANFAAGHEVGAALCVYRDGRKVVDMWGGYRDGISKAPWQADTMVNMFSSTKGVAALTIAHAVSKGLLDYDVRVSEYWPEFAAQGKGDVTVRQLLAHQAGLSVLTPNPTLADIADPVRLSPILAAQKPAWTPGTRHGYHTVTIGWYESELIRRTDPSGRTLGQYLAEEIAGPLGVDLHIGLPDGVDRSRVATLHQWKRHELFSHLTDMPGGVLIGSLNPRGLLARSAAIPADVDPYRGDYNREAVRRVEIPSANGTGTARALAGLYGSAAVGGAELGFTPEVFDGLTAPAPNSPEGSKDMVLRIETAYSLGFTKPIPTFGFGSSRRAFGTPGFGGSFGFADPDTGVGFGYVMNRLGFHIISDPRELAVRQALFRDVLGARSQT
ncbi:beta-lactamase family protein [Mycobacterium sp. CBMA293]|uniref:serine hydrolase domain-containing protein n=1 Tax=unclassified Mycolicibacterium TaxID=2636767 RepID=UPI0012DD5CD9|nr:MULTISPECIES: serine hydrolase domain-containing protein [unclassified Mycolicibacterium]MUL48581.1 beta-lactamase family protein [Mycolicibacterium sp. CBMA 360]MUL62038.1 beta-lactamase family protein [Mycolicibacterium sp. CBMA 335]MUL73313.1 beta-lactamase family protein [Mycolicibacterium sp. CBMA 311]MUL96482.1 beta-lactamase family protein [Mycolicibacterium sp. CBMA 230]MUM05380.1 EstA family serine hydrolase [Mycolicibacterium sp. CBMA 213]